MLFTKVFAPINKDIGVGLFSRPHQNQLFFQNLFYLKIRMVNRLMYENDVNQMVLQSMMQALRLADICADGQLRVPIAQVTEPTHQ